MKRFKYNLVNHYKLKVMSKLILWYFIVLAIILYLGLLK